LTELVIMNIISFATPVIVEKRYSISLWRHISVIMLLKLQLIVMLNERIFHSLIQFCEISLINFERSIRGH